MRIRGLALVAVVASAALVLAACGGGGSSSNGPSSSDILRMGSDSEIDSLNPFVGFNQLSYATFEISYPYLVQYDESLDFAPYFASDWSTSDDGKVWTFTTTPGAKWSDGETLDAEDVAWTFNTIVKWQHGGAGNWAGTVAHLKKVEATDANTAVFTYDTPVANVLSQLQQVPILPEQFWGQYADDGKFKTAKMTPPLVSGGPFIVQSYQKNAQVNMKANPDYWGTAPKVAGIGITMYEDDDAMIAALQNNEIDLIESLPVTGVKPLDDAGFNVDTVDSTMFYDFIFNSNPKKPEHRELLDPKVRQAFAMSFDLDNLIKTVWLGSASKGNSIVPPSTGKWSDPSLEAWPYDPAKANQLLDDLGYAKGSNGIRVADGHPMSYDVIMPDLTGGDRSFSILRDNLKAIGVEIKQKKVDDSTAFDLIGAPDYKYLDFDLAMWDWIMLPDPDYALSVVTCDQFGNWSDTGYCNPAYDKLYALQSTQTDVDQRLKTVYKMQQMLAQDMPYIYLGYMKWIMASSNDWSGYVNTINGPYNPLSPQSMLEVHKG